LLHEKGHPFFPYSAWRDVVFAVLIIAAIVALAVFIGAPPIEKPPDPSAVHASPRPDWYLLWIFALFALMPARIESYAIVIVPPLALFLLFALPFLRNSGERSPLRRPWAIAGVVSVITFVGALLIIGNKAPWSAKFDAQALPQGLAHSGTADAQEGMQLFQQKACIYCHRIDGHGGAVGPDLSLVGRRLNEQRMKLRIINGGHNMPAYGQSLRGDELRKIVAFLTSRK
jgi:ubiquinol-cytochrome c reductase cytochrome b subunit